jgi:hypothetical protein
LGGGAQQGISFEFEYLGEFEFIFETALGYESGGRETCFDEKTACKKSQATGPLKALFLLLQFGKMQDTFAIF